MSDPMSDAARVHAARVMAIDSGMPATERPRTRANAAERILHAAATCVSALGAARVSLQTVADEAGVSKALIHYHFRDRDELRQELVDVLTAEVVQGEEAALAGAAPTMGLDALWTWLEEELRTGRLRGAVPYSAIESTDSQNTSKRSR